MADKVIISGHWDNFFLSKNVICNIPIESGFPVRKVPSLWNTCDKCHDITQLYWNHNNKKVLSHLFAIFFQRISVTSRSLSLLHSFPRYYQIIASRTLVHLFTVDPHSQKSFCDTLKLTSDDILHFLCSVDLPKSFSQLIAWILFFNRFCHAEKCGVTQHCLDRDSLSLIKREFYWEKSWTSSKYLSKKMLASIVYSGSCIGLKHFSQILILDMNPNAGFFINLRS